MCHSYIRLEKKKNRECGQKKKAKQNPPFCSDAVNISEELQASKEENNTEWGN